MDRKLQDKLDSILENYDNKTADEIVLELKNYFLDMDTRTMVAILTSEKEQELSRDLWQSIMASSFAIYYDTYEDVREGMNEILLLIKSRDKEMLRIKDKEM